jgi:hypothetical protein
MLYNVKSSDVQVKVHECLILALRMDSTQLQALSALSPVYVHFFFISRIQIMWECLGKPEAKRTSKAVWDLQKEKPPPT